MTAIPDLFPGHLPVEVGPPAPGQADGELQHVVPAGRHTATVTTGLI